MATSGFDLLEQVKVRLLECQICQEPYHVQGRTPRVLPCHHSLCSSCLDRLKAQGPFPCPTCRSRVSIKEFPTEITRMTLLDLVSEAKSVSGGMVKCELHNKELEFRCADCKTFLCSKCAVFLHSGHGVEDLGPYLEEIKKQIVAVGKRLEGNLARFQTRVGRSKVSVQSLVKGQGKAAARIQALFSEVVARVRVREKQALEALQARFDADNRMLEAEHEGEQALLSEVQRLVQESQNSASQGLQYQLMSMVPQMEESCSKIEQRMFQDQQKAPVYQVEAGDEESLCSVLESVGNITALPRESFPEKEWSSTDLEAQKQRINSLLNKTLCKGDTWYLVDMKWFKQWKKYVGYHSWDTHSVGKMSAHPGCIDNATLLASDGSGGLRERLIDDLDYVMFPEEAWSDLVSWYGLADDRHSVARRVIEMGRYVKHTKVEVYLLDLKLGQHSEPNTFVLKQFSRTDTLGMLEEVMKNVFEIHPDIEVRLWNRYMSDTYEHLSKPENTLQDAGIYQGQVIIIEQRNADGSWPRSMKPK